MYSGIDLERKVRYITFTTKIAGQVITQDMPDTIFTSKSGVRTLLELDPQSEVIIKKPDGTELSYKYKK